MKLSSIVKIISAVSYFFIMLRGDMIALPFGIWLALSIFDFSSIGPLFALLAFTGGFFACFTRRNDKQYMVKIPVAFLLLLSPLIWRLSVVPLQLFNYTAFVLPLTIFMVFFMTAWALDSRNPTFRSEIL